MPDLPGYGLSEPLEKHDKLTVGTAILSALSSLLPSGQTNPIVIIGHDRGGRVAHRLTVSMPSIQDSVSNLHLLGTSVIDIVPTTVQWQGKDTLKSTAYCLSTILMCAQAFGYSPQASVNYWHWPFLATPFAPDFILAFGGGKYCTDSLQRITGPGKNSLSNLTSQNALDVYGAAFDNPSVVRASCGDYAAGATVDITAQKEDQEAGKKVAVPFLALHGAGYIAKTFNVGKVWEEWVDDKALLSVHKAAEGVGHFVPEEAPEETADVLISWLKKIRAAPNL